MKPLLRAYLVLLGCLAIGAFAAWHVQWHVTYNNCGMATDGTEDFYRMWAMCLGITLGTVGGCAFGLIAPKRQFLHALLFSVLAGCVAYVLWAFTRYICCPFDRYDAFVQWTAEHGAAWLDHAVFWLIYWIEEGIHYWLLPQLAAQLVAVVAAQRLSIRRRGARQKRVPANR